MKTLGNFESRVTWNGPRQLHMTTSCYGWTGRPNKISGRAMFCIDNNSMNASRSSWILYVGTIPDGMQVNHHCDNVICTRTEHLYLGTSKQNMNDRDNRGRHNNQNKNKTHCKRGHEFNEVNTQLPKRGGRECFICRRVYANARNVKRRLERSLEGVN